jgi:hypothetical protein
VRGFIDLLCGGVGVRRGRRDPEWLEVGDTVDWWRVETIEPNRRLRLIAEMKLPGRAWLEFEVTEDAGGALVRQTAIFDPVGLSGLAYWYLIYPLHQLIFAGMLRGITRACVRDRASSRTPPTQQLHNSSEGPIAGSDSAARRPTKSVVSPHGNGL